MFTLVYNQNSLRTYLARAFFIIGTNLGKKEADVRFTSDEHRDVGVGIVFKDSPHSHWAAAADIDVISFFDEAVDTLKLCTSKSANP